MAHERKCIVDNKTYKYCPHCGNNKNETWRFIYCSEDCRDVDNILKEFKSEKIDATAAKVKLSRYNFDKDNGTTYTAPIFASIYGKEVNEEPIAALDVQVEAEPTIVTDEELVPVVDEPKKNNKKNNRRYTEKKEIVNEDLIADNTEETVTE